MTFRIIPRTEAGLPAVVAGSNGAPRPPLVNERWMTGHYTGNNIDYTGKDAAEITRQIQRVFSTTKPFEYNYVIGQNDDDQIIEFAGKFQAAHSGGENGDSFGVLFLLGVGEEVTDLMIDKWRWLRDVLIADGSLSPNVEQLQHRQMPGAATACPGASVIRRWPEFLTPYIQTVTPQSPSETEETDMIAATILWRPKGYANTFAVTPNGSRHLGGETYRIIVAQLKAAGVDSTIVVSDHRQELKCILHQCGLTAADLVPTG
jgi:hypothetical protein